MLLWTLLYTENHMTNTTEWRQWNAYQDQQAAEAQAAKLRSIGFQVKIVAVQ